MPVTVLDGTVLDGTVLDGTVLDGTVLHAASGWRPGRATTPLLPMLNPGPFRNRRFSVADIVALSFSFGMVGWTFILIQFLHSVLGNPALEAGVMSVPWTLAPMVFALFLSSHRARVQPR